MTGTDTENSLKYDEGIGNGPEINCEKAAKIIFPSITGWRAEIGENLALEANFQLL